MAHLLVVDDEKSIRDGCVKILGKEGWALQTASSGEEGLRMIRQESFDLLLLDLKMPGLSGMEVLQRINQEHPGLMVVIITGYATIELAVEAMKGGAYDFIPKPFTPDQLRIVVHRALEKVALEREATHLRQERQRGLREIAGEKSKIKTIIHSMADGVLVTDHEGRVVLHNPSITRMLQMSLPPALNQFSWKGGVDDGLREMVEKIGRVCQEDGPIVSQEVKMGEATLMAHIAPVRSEEGDLLGTVTVLRDISMLKAMDQMKADFVVMVSHELRAPLGSIEQQLTLILAGILGEVNERQRDILGRAMERTHALLTLINDLLDLSRIEAGFGVQYKEPVPIIEVLEKVLGLLKIQTEKKRISLEFSSSGEVPLVTADRRNMEEVFTNLIHNAVKYTVEGGWVKVDVFAEGSYLCVRVSDSGIGISAEDLPHIFDKFYRVKNAQTRYITGTGLGLTIVKVIVEAHLGSVTVESQPGMGSTFRVFLPLDMTTQRRKGT